MGKTNKEGNERKVKEKRARTLMCLEFTIN